MEKEIFWRGYPLKQPSKTTTMSQLAGRPSFIKDPIMIHQRLGISSMPMEINMDYSSSVHASRNSNSGLMDVLPEQKR